MHVRVVVVAALFFSAPAWAQEKDTFGSGARQRAMGGAGVAGARGHDALYYNPAGLTLFPAIEGSAELNLIVPAVDVSSPSGAFNGDAEGDLDTIPFLQMGFSGPVLSEDCPNCRTSNAQFAHACPACGKAFASQKPQHWLQPFYWGIQLDIPLQHTAVVAATSDQNSPEWVEYGRQTERMAVALGNAYRIDEEFAVGVAFQLGTVSSGSIRNRFAGLSSDPSIVEFDQEVDSFVSVNLGFLWQPNDDLKLGFVYRSEQSTNVDQESVSDITALGVPTTAVVNFELTPYFAPQQVGLGFEWAASPELTVAFDLTWMDWSSAPGPYSFVTVVEGPITAPPHPDVGFKDTIVPRFGVEWLSSPELTLRGGYAFRPTPVPDQGDERTNLLDSDAHIFTVGAAYKVDDGMVLEGYFQWHWLTGQDATKSDPAANPREWELDGSIFVLAFGMRWTM